MTQQKRWICSPSAPKKPKVPESVKLELCARADEFIKSVLKPRYLQEPPANTDMNYVTDIYAKWYRNYFYFCAIRACPSERAISPSFETKFARMEYSAQGRYALSYFRHTEQWWQLYSDLTIDEALRCIDEEPFFHP